MFRANHPALLTSSSPPFAPLPPQRRRWMVPTRVTCPRINTATDRRPNPHPASQPPPAPPTFHVTHPLIPFSSADSHSGFAALSHAVPLSATFTLSIPRTQQLCFSFHHSHPRKPSTHHRTLPPRAITLPFSFLASSSFCPPACVLRSLSLPDSPLSPLNMPQGLVVSLGLACRLGQPPLLAKRSSKATGPGRHKKKMKRRERERRMYTEREKVREKSL